MKIAVASGKGGTGKTMVACSLALTLATHQPVQFLDCDVEAPNAHLFLNPQIQEKKKATLPIPEINPSSCTSCGRCVAVCAFNALAQVGQRILVFPQLCHGCGSCSLRCPEGAITEIPKPLGILRRGKVSRNIRFFDGELTISEPMPTPIIRQLKKFAGNTQTLTIMDSPPGASCSVVETVIDADFLLLVTEPTAFGWHDLRQMLGIIDQIHIPAGIIINRDGIGDPDIERRIQETGRPILMKIPHLRKIAEGLAAGTPLIKIQMEYQSKFGELFENIQDILGKGQLG